MNNKSGLKYQSWSRTQHHSQQKVLSETTRHLGVVSFAGLFGSCGWFWRAWMVSWCLSTGFAPSGTAGCWFWRCWFLENESFTYSYLKITHNYFIYPQYTVKGFQLQRFVLIIQITVQYSSIHFSQDNITSDFSSCN